MIIPAELFSLACLDIFNHLSKRYHIVLSLLRHRTVPCLVFGNNPGSDLRPRGRNRGYMKWKSTFVKEHGGVIADSYSHLLIRRLISLSFPESYFNIISSSSSGHLSIAFVYPSSVEMNPFLIYKINPTAP